MTTQSDVTATITVRNSYSNSTSHTGGHKTDMVHWLGQTLASSRALPILQKVQGQEAISDQGPRGSLKAGNRIRWAVVSPGQASSCQLF